MIGGVIFLNKKTWESGDIRIAGCTLWSHILEEQRLVPEMKGELFVIVYFDTIFFFCFVFIS